MPTKRRICVLDLETDPFEANKVPKPFVAGFYDGDTYQVIWGDDCIASTVAMLETIPEPLMIFAHNGGKFDWLYFLKYLGSRLRIVNGRIIQATLGKHEIRDSFSIMPFPLRVYDKDEIDYNVMRLENRDRHRDEIIKYLRKDCVALHELCTAFHTEFGNILTVGSAAMREIKARHQFASGGQGLDNKFRENFYFGGRNQCFESGLLKGNWKIFDTNSMYPYAMKAYLHPIGIDMQVSKHVEPDSCFVVAEGWNYGAFPTRGKQGLDFTVPFGTFHVTIHEWNAALEVGAFKPKRVIKSYVCHERATFEEFVDHFYNTRRLAKVNKDKIREILYKYVLNSGYGKFSQNPDNFSEFTMTDLGDRPSLDWYNEGWRPAHIQDTLDVTNEKTYIIWSKPSPRRSYHNICTGASITGASRAMLLQGIHAANRPIYCDTDSIICEGIDANKVNLHDSDLGAWKLEGTGNLAAICGKKLYAIFDTNRPLDRQCTSQPCKACQNKGCDCVKKAHKGARLTAKQIMRIALGETIEYANPVPCFGLDGSATFTTRRIRRTA